MIKRILLLFLSFILIQKIWCLPCYFTLVKDNCWTDYNVTVDVFEAGSEKKILSILVPAGKSWSREQINCEPKQNLIYRASFNPIFWKNDEGKVYRSLRNWSLPDKINAGDKAWGLPICYPADFSSVPLPPTATSHCKCDFLPIPQIKVD